MMIKEAVGVFWQTLKDTWEELYSLAIVNLVWLFGWVAVGSLAWLFASWSIIVLAVLFLLLAVGALAVTTAGMYCVTNRVAHGKTFHFSDFVEGIKKFWWRSVLWILGNALLVFLVLFSLNFYTALLEGLWAVLAGGFFLGLLGLWLATQMYFWPFLVEQKEPKTLMAWRNSAYLLLANPIYALFIGSFTLLFTVISAAIPLVLIFVGMAVIALLGNNATLTLLAKFGVIEEARPKPLV